MFATSTMVPADGMLVPPAVAGQPAPKLLMLMPPGSVAAGAAVQQAPVATAPAGAVSSMKWPCSAAQSVLGTAVLIVPGTGATPAAGGVAGGPGGQTAR